MRVLPMPSRFLPSLTTRLDDQVRRGIYTFRDRQVSQGEDLPPLVVIPFAASKEEHIILETNTRFPRIVSRVLCCCRSARVLRSVEYGDEFYYAEAGLTRGSGSSFLPTR